MKTNNPTNQELREKRYKLVRKIFKRHYACAFRNDLNPDVLDCLVYMAEEIVNLSDDWIRREKRKILERSISIVTARELAYREVYVGYTPDERLRRMAFDIKQLLTMESKSE